MTIFVALVKKPDAEFNSYTAGNQWRDSALCEVMCAEDSLDHGDTAKCSDKGPEADTIGR